MIQHPSYQKDQSTRKKGFSVTYGMSASSRAQKRQHRGASKQAPQRDNSQASSPATKTPSHTATPTAAKSYAGDFKRTRVDPAYCIILFSMLEVGTTMSSVSDGKELDRTCQRPLTNCTDYRTHRTNSTKHCIVYSFNNTPCQ